MEIVELPSNPDELREFIRKINSMRTVTDSFKAIMNSAILPEHKIECIQWYNSYYGSFVQNTQEYLDQPPPRYPRMGLVLDADVEARRKAEEARERYILQQQRNEFHGRTAAPAKAAQVPQIDAQTWTEWRKSKLGFGGKTRKSRSKRYAKF